ncbi:glycosyltransferase [Bacteroidota bacterium]
MKNLLIIAYYFPPSGGPGVQRVLKHVQYLPEFGWNPIVLTVSNGQFPARDESLLEKIPGNIPVYRSHIYEPYDLYRKLTGKKQGTAIDVNVIKKDDQKISFKEKIAEFIRATFFIPDARAGWRLSAGKAINQIRKEHKIDAIYSSSPPYTCSLIARNFKRRSGLPWIAGFRDPWRGFISTPKRWFIPELIDIMMEKSVFTEADAVECAWEGIIKDALGKYPMLNKSKFHHIPNGFDSADFPKVEKKRNEKFTVTYTGSMYGRRNPASFFEAIELLVSQGKIKPDELHLRFVGRFGAEVHEMFDKTSYKNAIEIIDYVPHNKSMEYLMLSAVLLLVVDESKESSEIVPGKVYEYIGVQRPIIAIAPHDGAIATLIEETKSGHVAHQTEIELTAEIIEDYYKQWESDNWDYNPIEEKVNKYERRKSAKMLAALFDGLVNS